VGASDTSGRGNMLITSLRQVGFPGDIYPVNPSRDRIWDLRCYPRLQDLPERPDLAMLLVRPELVLGMIEDCGALGVGAAVVVAGGFAETGEDRGLELQRRLVETARRHGVVVCGPNCQGVIDREASVAAYAGPVDAPLLPGGVAVISQSGGNASSLITTAFDRHVGLSHVVSSGNEADLDLCDYLDHLHLDPAVKAFILFAETIRDPERLLALAGRASQLGKPIVIVKVGRSAAGRTAANAHTGAFVGGTQFDDALF
jgi:acyl-CoA synthetase (NDP forming)